MTTWFCRFSPQTLMNVWRSPGYVTMVDATTSPDRFIVIASTATRSLLMETNASVSLPCVLTVISVGSVFIPLNFLSQPPLKLHYFHSPITVTFLPFLFPFFEFTPFSRPSLCPFPCSFYVSRRFLPLPPLSLIISPLRLSSLSLCPIHTLSILRLYLPFSLLYPTCPLLSPLSLIPSLTHPLSHSSPLFLSPRYICCCCGSSHFIIY